MCPHARTRTAGPQGRSQSLPAVCAEDRDLVHAVLRKDRKAAADFIDRYADPVYAYVRQRLAPKTDQVDDLVQDVFLVALENLQTFAGDSSVRTWLIGIARHKVEDHYRALLRTHATIAEWDDESDVVAASFPDLDALIDQSRLEEKTRRILSQLPEAYRLALMWRYWEQRGADEMAAQAGKTEKAIERLLARARARFKQLWEAE